MKFFRAKVRLWPLIVVPVVLAAGVIAASLSGVFKPVSFFAALFSDDGGSTHTSETVERVLPQQEIILASAHIEGIERVSNDGRMAIFPGWKLDGNERTTFVQYEFDAKLGIDGSAVTITPDGDGGYAVVIPEFRYLGNDEPHFEDPIEGGGPLTWLTEGNDTADIENDILSGRNADEYVSQSEEVLRVQAEAFYTSIIRAVAPRVAVAFTFADSEDKESE